MKRIVFVNPVEVNKILSWSDILIPLAHADEGFGCERWEKCTKTRQGKGTMVRVRLPFACFSVCVSWWEAKESLGYQSPNLRMANKIQSVFHKKEFYQTKISVDIEKCKECKWSFLFITSKR